MYIHNAMYIIERLVEKLAQSNSHSQSKGLLFSGFLITSNKAPLRVV